VVCCAVPATHHTHGMAGHTHGTYTYIHTNRRMTYVVSVIATSAGGRSVRLSAGRSPRVEKRGARRQGEREDKDTHSLTADRKTAWHDMT